MAGGQADASLIQQILSLSSKIDLAMEEDKPRLIVQRDFLAQLLREQTEATKAVAAAAAAEKHKAEQEQHKAEQEKHTAEQQKATMAKDIANQYSEICNALMACPTADASLEQISVKELLLQKLSTLQSALNSLISGVSSDFQNELRKETTAACLEISSLHSKTREGSAISEQDLARLLASLKLQLRAVPDSADWNTVFSKATPDQKFWNDGDTEISRREDYMKMLENEILKRNARKTRTRMYGRVPVRRIEEKGLPFPIAAIDDVLFGLTSWEGCGLGALLGIEVKRKIDFWKNLRQAIVEFIVCANYSSFPFIQLLTDMERGGVAIYLREADGVQVLEYRVFDNWKEFIHFAKQVVENLPEDLGEDVQVQGKISMNLPSSLDGPARKSWKIPVHLDQTEVWKLLDRIHSEGFEQDLSGFEGLI